MSEEKPKRERKRLSIECRKTQCDQNRHCFLDAPKQKKARERLSSPVPVGVAMKPETKSASEDTAQRHCWNCGVNPIDWPRLYTKDPADLDHVIHSLRYEAVRQEFWCKEFDPWAVNRARRRGRHKMPEYAEKRIRQSVAAAQPFKDGFQTPGEGDVLFYAQHATATCCRICMEIWYGIPRGRELTADEVTFCTQLLLRYVDERMPDLNEEPLHVPSIRKAVTEEAPEVRN